MEENIIVFLRELASSIEEKKISDEKLKLISEFYMSYNFHSELDNTDADIEEKDFIKFLVMGWYIYCILLKNRKSLT
jgi:hypothetical protein